MYSIQTTMNLKPLILAAAFAISASTAAADKLADAFRDPAEETKPYCFWYWLNADITADGITKGPPPDLLT